MYIRKLILLNPEQIKGLEKIEAEIREKGGSISKAQLIRDSVQIFLDYFKEDAVMKYSSGYELKEKVNRQASEPDSN